MDIKDYEQQGGAKHFWHLARLKFLAWLIGQVPGDNLRIASVGSGTGEELRLLAERGTVIGWEINERAASLAKQSGWAIANFDISQGESEDCYDLICAFDVLEHISNDTQTLININSCLKSKGYLLLTVPAHPWLFSSHDEALGHKRRYAKQDLVKKLQTADFQVELVGYWNTWLFPLIATIRLLKKIWPPSRPKSEAGRLPPIINQVGLAILKSENYLIANNFKFPVGLSLYAIAKKL